MLAMWLGCFLFMYLFLNEMDSYSYLKPELFLRSYQAGYQTPKNPTKNFFSLNQKPPDKKIMFSCAQSQTLTHTYSESLLISGQDKEFHPHGHGVKPNC